jgi:hypothetical protein
MNPPSVYELTSPNNHKTANTTAMVHSILNLPFQSHGGSKLLTAYAAANLATFGLRPVGY